MTSITPHIWHDWSQTKTFVVKLSLVNVRMEPGTLNDRLNFTELSINNKYPSRHLAHESYHTAMGDWKDTKCDCFK